MVRGRTEVPTGIRGEPVQTPQCGSGQIRVLTQDASGSLKWTCCDVPNSGACDPSTQIARLTKDPTTGCPKYECIDRTPVPCPAKPTCPTGKVAVESGKDARGCTVWECRDQAPTCPTINRPDCRSDEKLTPIYGSGALADCVVDWKCEKLPEPEIRVVEPEIRVVGITEQITAEDFSPDEQGFYQEVFAPIFEKQRQEREKFVEEVTQKVSAPTAAAGAGLGVGTLVLAGVVAYAVSPKLRSWVKGLFKGKS